MRSHADVRNHGIEHALHRHDQQHRDQSALGGERLLSQPAAKHQGARGADEAHEAAGCADRHLPAVRSRAEEQHHCHGADSREKIDEDESPRAEGELRKWSQDPQCKHIHGEVQRAEMQEQRRDQPPPFTRADHRWKQAAQAVEDLQVGAAAQTEFRGEHAEIENDETLGCSRPVREQRALRAESLLMVVFPRRLLQHGLGRRVEWLRRT